MAFIIVPGTAQVELRATAQGEQVENVFHFTKDPVGGWDAATLLALCQSVWDNFVSNVIPGLSSTYVLREVYARDLSEEFGLVASYDGTAPVPGALADEPMPNNVSIVCTYRTGLAGRSFRGRSYLVGFVEPQFVGNSMGATPFATFQSIWTSFLEDVEADGHIQVIASRYTGGAPRTLGVATPVISRVFRENKARTQRRRLD